MNAHILYHIITLSRTFESKKLFCRIYKLFKQKPQAVSALLHIPLLFRFLISRICWLIFAQRVSILRRKRKAMCALSFFPCLGKDSDFVLQAYFAHFCLSLFFHKAEFSPFRLYQPCITESLLCRGSLRRYFGFSDNIINGVEQGEMRRIIKVKSPTEAEISAFPCIQRHQRDTKHGPPLY